MIQTSYFQRLSKFFEVLHALELSQESSSRESRAKGRQRTGVHGRRNRLPSGDTFARLLP